MLAMAISRSARIGMRRPAVRLQSLLLLAAPLLLDAWQPALRPAARPAVLRCQPQLLLATPEAMKEEVRAPPEAAAIDWSFLDAVYVITCPQPDGTNPRLGRAREILRQVGLESRVEVREFQPDDEDRVRGCYTSHIAVLEEAERSFPGDGPLNVLVLEDNLSLSTRLEAGTVESVEAFLRGAGAPGAEARDVLHLAYIMYVPGLSVAPVERSDGGVEEHIVGLRSTADSVLGTTAYVITRSGLSAVLAEHRKSGYVDAIPNVMARLFPTSRFAAYPMAFHRAAAVKSLVNGQLDTLRAMIFKPEVYTWWERLLVSSKQSTNVLFPTLVGLLFVAGLGSVAEVVNAVAAKSRGEEVGLVLPLINAVLATGFLGICGYGLALAPPPQPQQPAEEESK